jgi:hypothetical protein
LSSNVDDNLTSDFSKTAKSMNYGASPPTARGGLRGRASILILKSCQRCFAILDLRRRDRPARLADHVKQDEQIDRASVEDPVVSAAVVATQLSQWAVNLRGVRKRQWRIVVCQPIQAVDLEVDRHALGRRNPDLLRSQSLSLGLKRELSIEEFRNRLGAIGGSVIDGLCSHSRANLAPAWWLVHFS